jgi:hypothetical protein
MVHFKAVSTCDTELTLEHLLNVIQTVTFSPPEEYTNHEVQKQQLGSFYNENVSLPVKHDKIEMRLFGLFDNTGMRQKKWKKESNTSFCPVVYIGVSGAGKTYQVHRHCAEGYVLYSTCGDHRDELDHYMKWLREELQCIKISGETLATRQSMAQTCIMYWITVKLVCLLHLLQTQNEWTPLQFALSQINGSTTYYYYCLNACSSIDAYTDVKIIQTLHLDAITAVRNLLPQEYKQKIGIAFDEAQMLSDQFTEEL